VRPRPHRAPVRERRAAHRLHRCATIVPIVVGESMRTFLFWKALFDHGVFTNPVIPPAVPEGSSRIRTSVMASHTDAQVDAALEKIQRAGKQVGLI